METAPNVDTYTRTPPPPSVAVAMTASTKLQTKPQAEILREVSDTLLSISAELSQARLAVHHDDQRSAACKSIGEQEWRLSFIASYLRNIAPGIPK